MATALYRAIAEWTTSQSTDQVTNQLTVIKQLLADEWLDVNSWLTNPHGWTALHKAVADDRADIIKLLLTHPDIDVEERGDYRLTAFHLACRLGYQDCILTLLGDRRVDFNNENTARRIFFECLIKQGQLNIIKWWIANCRLPHNRVTDWLLRGGCCYHRELDRDWLTKDNETNPKVECKRVDCKTDLTVRQEADYQCKTLDVVNCWMCMAKISRIQWALAVGWVIEAVCYRPETDQTSH